MRRAMQARVGERHDRVLVAGEDQGRLPNAVQPRQARPARDGVELEGVAEGVGWPAEAGGGLALEQRGLAAGAAAGDAGDLEAERPWVVVAGRRGEQEGGVWPWRHAAEAGRGGAQDQAADALRRAARQLLCEAASERVAEDVDLTELELVEQRDHHSGEPAHPERARRALGAARSRGVEGDDLAAGHEPDERLPHVQVGADARDEHQRRAAARARDPQPQPGRAHDERLPAHANAPTPVMSRPTISVCMVSVPS